MHRLHASMLNYLKIYDLGEYLCLIALKFGNLIQKDKIEVVKIQSQFKI